MKQRLFRFILCAAVFALFVVTAVQAQKGKNKVSESKAAVTASKITNSGTGQCKAPRPPNRGCKIACKPCQVPVCEDGKWKYENIPIDKDACRPHSDDNSGACKIGPTEYCPPSCKTCIRQ